jgi:hypothetical protein
LGERWELSETPIISPIAAGINSEANQMSNLQIKLLMRRHGLTESQARMLVDLIWGAGQ